MADSGAPLPPASPSGGVLANKLLFPWSPTSSRTNTSHWLPPSRAPARKHHNQGNHTTMPRHRSWEIILAPTRLQPQCLVPTPEGISIGMVNIRCWDVPGVASTWSNSVGRKAGAHRAGHAHHPHSSAFPTTLQAQQAPEPPLPRHNPGVPMPAQGQAARRSRQRARVPWDEGNNLGHLGTTAFCQCWPTKDQSLTR